MSEQLFITERLRRYYNDPNLTIMIREVQGGDIHQSYMVRIRSSSSVPDKLFLKCNEFGNSEVLAAESRALAFFQKTEMLNCYPKPIMFDGDAVVKQPRCMLFMEYCDLIPVGYNNAVLLGESLARQHNIHAQQFGWESDNFIGTTPQFNQWSQHWPTFFAEQRLAPQLALAKNRGLNKSAVSVAQLIIKSLAVYFEVVTTDIIKPSLLHGDLWAGNLAVRRLTNKPLLYDPAPYFGDPEVDIAMTKLFGRMPDSFYEAYHCVHPTRSGQSERAKVYDLYHLLNHFNLFGEGYEVELSSRLDEVLKELSSEL